MEKQKFINGLLCLVIGCVGVSCTASRTADEELLKEKLIGSWAILLENKASDLFFLNDSIYYSELHVLNDSACIFINEPVVSLIPDPYSWINKDTIQIFYHDFGISLKGDTLLLSANDKVWKHERVHPDPTSIPGGMFRLSDGILDRDMFMIRQCNFLAAKGIISVPQACKQLKRYVDEQVRWEMEARDIEEEFIEIKHDRDSTAIDEFTVEKFAF